MVIGVTISGIAGVTLAYLGFSYWGYATQGIVYVAVNTACNWYFSSWRPTFEFNLAPIKHQHFDGVFYRNADFYAYTDMENAEFYEDEYSTFYIWYYDGVNRYLLGNDYTIGEDGLAYHDEDGLIYPAGWIPEEPYDPAVDWGANWMDNWDI